MFDSRGLPHYPPPHNAWQFPPPPVSSRWKWLAIAATVVGSVGGAAMLVVAIGVGSSGLPGAIDDPQLISVIERECGQMRSTVESMPVTGSPEQQATTIADQNHAIDVMVSAIRSQGQAVLKADPPTQDWLADWDRLVAARKSYATRILDGSMPDLDIPKDEHGKDIYLRMDDVWLGESTCEVPGVLLDPYPDDDSQV